MRLRVRDEKTFAAGFGVAGAILRELGCVPASLVLALVPEPVLEENFRRAMLVARGDVLTFVERPISLGILLLTVVIVVLFSRRKAMTVARGAGQDTTGAGGQAAGHG